jgi:uncharacterized cysteine cluster protein YcgN (CxxCxxCC family)
MSPVSKRSHRPTKSRRQPERPAARGNGRRKPGSADADGDTAVWAAEGAEKPFWETKRLGEMSPAEWDSLCDGCGQCCLNKIEDEDSGRVFLTRLACSLLDLGSCRCKDYENRFQRMPDCLSVDLKAVQTLKWLPESCAYRRIDEGRGLAWWHPLISGDADTVHQAGVSVRDWARSEKGVREDDIARYIIGEAV